MQQNILKGTVNYRPKAEVEPFVGVKVKCVKYESERYSSLFLPTCKLMIATSQSKTKIDLNNLWAIIFP